MFRLQRYFSASAGVAVAVLTTILVLANAWKENAAFSATEERHNASMAHAIYNSIAPKVEGYLEIAGSLDRKALLARPETSMIDTIVAAAVQDLPVLKVKLHAPNGVVVYSSQHSDIGSRAKPTRMATVISGGVPVNKIEWRKEFVALDGVRNDIQIIGTYVPIKSETGRTVAVLEVYSDITAQSAVSKREMAAVGASLLAAFMVLFGVLFLLVRHADQTLRRQHAAFNGLLEAKVVERTAAAERAAKDAQVSAEQLRIEVQERRNIEQALRQQRAWLLKQQGVLGDLIRRDFEGAHEWMRAVQTLLERATETLGIERGSVWMFGEAQCSLDCIDLYTRADGRHVAGRHLEIDPGSPYVLALAKDAIIDARNAGADPRLAQFAETYLTPHGITSVLDVPIIRDGKVAGVFSLGHVGAPRDWLAEHKAFASAIASLIALVLEERDRITAEQNLRRTNAKLEHATRVKSEFLATMSHEIRTPLNGVLGMLALVTRDPLSPAQLRFAGIAKASAESLLAILNDVLDFSKLDSGHVEIERVNFSLHQVLYDVTELLEPRAAAKGLAFDLRVDQTIPALVGGDPTRLRQVLLNLIGNAIKFTESGHVEVNVTTEQTEHNGIVTRFAISDTGMGIAPEHQHRLFTRFSQGDASTTRRFGGTGLGLAISKQLVELMGGTIAVVSKQGEGSCFTFELPMATVTSAVVKADTKSEIVALRKGLRVLAVDDNPVNQIIVEELLLDAGCTVDLASGGHEAVEAVMARTYDVVLMDIQMPDMDGVAATTAIRALPGPASGVPIIALTANALAGQDASYRAAGMNGYAVKPFRAADLCREILRVVGTRDARFARRAVA